MVEYAASGADVPSELRFAGAIGQRSTAPRRLLSLSLEALVAPSWPAEKATLPARPNDRNRRRWRKSVKLVYFLFFRTRLVADRG